MGKFANGFNKAKKSIEKVENVSNNYNKKEKEHVFNNQRLKQKKQESVSDESYKDFENEFLNDDKDFDDRYGPSVQIAQKPESFHQFILENKYQDLEKSIRGYKDVHNKETREWELKRKDKHCFTDEEAEDILRTAQGLLSTDIKLGFINTEAFGLTVMMLYKRVRQLFREIAEYRYGRYSHNKDGLELPGGFAIEQAMKLQNLKIFVELTERIKANYSRSIAGIENKLTHQSVSAQESLQSTDRIEDSNRRYS